MTEKLTRQQIYDRIRETSKDRYILEEMKRLGFWDSSPVPTLSEILIKRKETASKELEDLLQQDRRYRNQEAMLREMRQERMKKAKEKREQTKQKNKQLLLDKAARWKQLQLEQIIYLGKGVSAGLNFTEPDVEKLQQYKLPVFISVKELAESMQTDLPSLRYLLYYRRVSKSTHYYTFEIPKKTGGKRKISAPKKKLKQLQQWVLENILTPLPVGAFSHGFVKERSIVTNAQPHIGKDIVINADLKDFFPTIDYRRVKGLFRALGYPEQLAIIFALICTQEETDRVEMDGVTYYVRKGRRFLPQGSPASPAISNIIAYKLDRRLSGMASAFGFNYTRYADDLTFSATKENEKNITRLLHFLKKTVNEEGFVLHPDKTHLMRKGGLQKVTGIVVNEKPNVERSQLRNFRALLHNIEKNGWKDQQWGQAKNLIHAVEGYIHFVNMVNPEKATAFYEQLKRIVNLHGRPEIKVAEKKKTVPEGKTEEIEWKNDTAEPTQETGNDWWNIFS